MGHTFSVQQALRKMMPRSVDTYTENLRKAPSLQLLLNGSRKTLTEKEKHMMKDKANTNATDVSGAQVFHFPPYSTLPGCHHGTAEHTGMWALQSAVWFKP